MIFPADAPGDSPASTRTRVKICGLTNPTDAARAVELGADALGLNFYPGSPRCLDLSRDASWLRDLRAAAVPRVAVVVNASHEEIARLVDHGVVDAVQLHGDEDAAFCQALRAMGIPFIKAIRVRAEEALGRPERYRADTLLLDAYHPGAYGGTGQAVDWALATRFAARHPGTLLAGGLGPDNVAAAICAVAPYGVDVASGVEGHAGPRRKDAEKMRAFFAAVRAANPARPSKSRAGV